MDAIFDPSTGTITTGALTTVLAFVALLFMYYDSKSKHSYWKERGIKGPKPLPLVGNLISIFTGNRLAKELEWVRKYGKVYGLYYGNSPHLVVADPEILTQICIKDFEVFPNHAPYTDFAHKYLKAALFNLKNENWKRTRALMSPTFTSGKVRRMFRFLDGCADDLIQGFNEQLQQQRQTKSNEAVVDVRNQFSLYTMDSIATCCYGLKLERAGSTDSPKNGASQEEFRKQGERVFKFSRLRMFTGYVFPKPLLELVNFQVTPDKDIMPLIDRLQRLVSQRRGSNKKFDDYLQLLIDARLDERVELDGGDDETELADIRQTRDSLLSSDANDIGEKSSKASLTDFEIISNATALMVTGIETTSTLLSHCTYALAFHPTVQEHLYDELMKIGHKYDPITKRCKFDDYAAITSCDYLDAVVSETLRMMSPVIQINRESRHNYHLNKYDLAMPRGSKVELAYYAIHNDPDYWPNANRFDPDRFMPENRDKLVPGSFSPFGIGPRHCLGMRFSLAESKLALAKLIAHFRFEPAPNTEFPGEPKRVFGFYHIKTPLVTIISRIDTL